MIQIETQSCYFNFNVLNYFFHQRLLKVFLYWNIFRILHVFFYFYIKLNDCIENEYLRDVEVELMARINGRI